MRYSNLRQLWTGEIEPCLPSLKHVDLSFSKKLATLPNFGNSLKLETLQTTYCENLKDIPDFSQLTKLVKLDLHGCSEFRILRQLPPSVIELDLSFTKIKTVEKTLIDGLPRLEMLLLARCEELESLPDNISVLKDLGHLSLSMCPKLLTLPALHMPVIEGSPSENLLVDGLRSLRWLVCPGYRGETLPSLKSLVLLRGLEFPGSNVKSLPEDIKYLTNLWKIDVSDCKSLSCIPELPPSLLYLDASNCTSLQKYSHLSSVEYDDGLLSQFDVDEFDEEGYEGYLHMKFNNCFNLDKDASNKILRDLWLRKQSVFIPLLETGCDKYPWLWPIVSSGACIPGNAVPEWCKYSDTGPSIQVNTNRLHPIGFYFFVVFGGPPNSYGCMWDIAVTCKGFSESGEFFDSCCSINYAKDINILFQTEHTFVWCHHLGWQELLHNNQFYLNGVTFHFSAKMKFQREDVDFIGNSDSDEDDEDNVFIVKNAAIVECGLMPFYNNDDNE